jgi:hypothetical protein
MSHAYVPYNGTAGWSGTDTSKARALDNVKSGKELNNQQLALHLLKKAGTDGLTWKELSEATGMHHGTASGVLSILHKEGAAARRVFTRMRCKIYIHQDYKDLVITEAYVIKKKLCPHCGNDINA